MHANGWGVPMNDVEAAKYYRLAAEGGFVQAMTSLAYVTYRGIGVEEDVTEGYMWYYIASKLDEFSAIADRDELGKHLTPEQIAGAEQKAAEWLEIYQGKVLQAGRSDL